MHPPLVIHPATPHDAPVVARIDADSWNEGFGELMPVRPFNFDRIECWRRDLDAPLPYRWWVAEYAGTVAGFAGIGPSRDPIDPELGELDTIAVDPRHWRLGIGRALMATALKQLEADGYQAAILWTLANYPQGQYFYKATGWYRDGGSRRKHSQIRYRRLFAN